VVDPVAALLGARVGERARVVAVVLREPRRIFEARGLERGVTVAVVVLAGLRARDERSRSIAHAIVVATVADLGSVEVDARVRVVAVARERARAEHVGVTVAVVVLGGMIEETVAVVVHAVAHLGRVGRDAGAIVGAVAATRERA